MIEPREMARYEREIRAMIRKAGADDPEAFAQVVDLLDSLQGELCAAARHLRAPRTRTITGRVGIPGHSWADIGRALGVTRSAAQQRFGRHRDDL